MFKKPQSLVYLEPSTFFESDDFWRFCSDFRKKYGFKKIFFSKFFFSNFCENCHEIAKNCKIDKIKTVPNRQDFGLTEYIDFLRFSKCYYSIFRKFQKFFLKISHF